jgi:hypothetical protein
MPSLRRVDDVRGDGGWRRLSAIAQLFGAEGGFAFSTAREGWIAGAPVAGAGVSARKRKIKEEQQRPPIDQSPQRRSTS